MMKGSNLLNYDINLSYELFPLFHNKRAGKWLMFET